jgi:aryl-alcohol dehydrogenase-like predicted oxidoreductase
MVKIVLGTAQFGMEYGINNAKGKVSQEESFKILNRSLDYGIDTVDTARAYGDSEKLLGYFIKRYDKKLKVVSKLPICRHEEVGKIVSESLENLNMSRIHGYLVHDFENYKKDQAIWDELEKIKKNGQIEKIGFSLYFPQDIEFIFKQGIGVDIIQIPFSIFDQRFEPYLFELQRKKVEVYARSVFLQGLVFKKVTELSGQFERIKDKIIQINSISKKTKIPIFALCVNFAMHNEYIDKIVLGVDNIDHLNEIVKCHDYLSEVEDIMLELGAMRIDDEKVVLPFNWKRA